MVLLIIVSESTQIHFAKWFANELVDRPQNDFGRKIVVEWPLHKTRQQSRAS